MIMMKSKKILFVLLALILLFIWGNSLLSKGISGAISDFIQYNIFHFANSEVQGEVNSTPIRKLAHFVEFAALGGVWTLYLRPKKRYFLKAFTFSAAAACMDETIQIFSHRGNSIRDVLLDSCGALFGVLVIFLWIRLIEKEQ